MQIKFSMIRVLITKMLSDFAGIQKNESIFFPFKIWKIFTFVTFLRNYEIFDAKRLTILLQYQFIALWNAVV